MLMDVLGHCILKIHLLKTYRYYSYIIADPHNYSSMNILLFSIEYKGENQPY